MVETVSDVISDTLDWSLVQNIFFCTKQCPVISGEKKNPEVNKAVDLVFELFVLTSIHTIGDGIMYTIVFDLDDLALNLSRNSW